MHEHNSTNSFIQSEAHVVIDICATDEQIKNEFTHWLAHYRKSVDSQQENKLYTQTDLDYWDKYAVIPYIDLVFMAKISGKKITHNKLARLIFPNEYDVDIVDRLRKVTKPAAEELLKNKIHKTLSRQLAYQKVE